MVVFKSLWGAIIGAIAGVIAGNILAVIIQLIIGITLVILNGGLLKEKPDISADAIEKISIVLSVFVGMIGGFMMPICDEEKRKQDALKKAEEQEEESKRLNLLKKEQEKKALEEERDSLEKLLEESRELFISFNQLVLSANASIDEAEREFKENAYAPFWDEIENATNILAQYQYDVNRLRSNAKTYKSRAKKINISIPEFNVPLGGITDARPVAIRLKGTVRMAQKNFQFAMIYEQRKTNQLLYSGFGTLASAINSMHNSITNALDNLSNTLNVSCENLVSISNEQTDILNSLEEKEVTTMELQHKMGKDLLAENKKQTKMIDKQNEMIDNIRHKKKTLL